jgi:RNA polymerase sigma-70 factor (ECF subfamily)
MAHETSLAGQSDEELMALVDRKDLAALETLYNRHHRLALAVAYRVLGEMESAEDIVQETFLAAWRQASSYRADRGQARAWLLSIARNRAIDRLRREWHGGPTEALDEALVDEQSPDVFAVAIRTLDRERIRAALRTLSKEQRETVELAFYGGLSQSEIATKAGLPLGTVKGRMRLAMEKLRLALADLAPEAGGAG